MQRGVIIAFCCLSALHATGQNTQTPEDIQRLKDAVIARQQAYMRGGKDTAAAKTPPEISQPLQEAAPAPKGQSGMDYAHNAMFKKFKVAVSMRITSGDTASNKDEQMQSGNGVTSTATMKLTMYAFNLMGRTVLAGGPDGIIDIAVNGKLQASGYEHSPNTNTSYTRSGTAVTNPLPSVAFTYNSDTSWSASVTLNYAINSNSNPAIVTDRTSTSQEADQDNGTLTHSQGSFVISRKISVRSKEEAGPRKQNKEENGSFTMTISPDR